jgi:4-nitrophenyl phosphatase
MENRKGIQLDLTTLKGLVIDIDGTLWRGDAPLPGQKELFAFLTSRAIPFVVATNNTHDPAAYRRKFLGAGTDLPEEQILTASEATAEYLAARHSGAIDGTSGPAGLPGSPGAPGAPRAPEPPKSPDAPKNLEAPDTRAENVKVFVIGYGDLQKAITRRGFSLVEDARQGADYVVIGGDFNLTYEKLKDAILLVSRGAALIGSNPDMLIPTEEGLVPEAGTTLAAVEAATGRRPLIIGKPERHLFDLAVARLGLGHERHRVAMVGDRVETDVVGAHAAGLRSILLCTGVDNEASAKSLGVIPDAVYSDLHTLIVEWEGLIQG